MTANRVSTTLVWTSVVRHAYDECMASLPPPTASKRKLGSRKANGKPTGFDSLEQQAFLEFVAQLRPAQGVRGRAIWPLRADRSAVQRAAPVARPSIRAACRLSHWPAGWCRAPPDITRMLDKLAERGLVSRHRPEENRARGSSGNHTSGDRAVRRVSQRSASLPSPPAGSRATPKNFKLSWNCYARSVRRTKTLTLHCCKHSPSPRPRTNWSNHLLTKGCFDDRQTFRGRG